MSFRGHAESSNCELHSSAAQRHLRHWTSWPWQPHVLLKNAGCCFAQCLCTAVLQATCGGHSPVQMTCTYLHHIPAMWRLSCSWPECVRSITLRLWSRASPGLDFTKQAFLSPETPHVQAQAQRDFRTSRHWGPQGSMQLTITADGVLDVSTSQNARKERPWRKQGLRAPPRTLGPRGSVAKCKNQ